MSDLVKSLLDRGPFDYVPREVAKDVWAGYRDGAGLSPIAVPLLSMPDGNAKMRKTAEKSGVFVCGLALASSDLSGNNVCRFATKECRDNCLSYAGQNAMSKARNAQIVKTGFLNAFPSAFLTLLMFEIDKAQRDFGSSLRIRLNMLSDIPWESVHPEIFEVYPGVRFYDYTKWPFAARKTPPNYDLTYSASERTKWTDIWWMTRKGARVAVVFPIKRDQPMIESWNGIPVIDGDASDDRYLNARGCVVGLRAKGRMRKVPVGGMVKEIPTIPAGMEAYAARDSHED